MFKVVSRPFSCTMCVSCNYLMQWLATLSLFSPCCSCHSNKCRCLGATSKHLGPLWLCVHGLTHVSLWGPHSFTDLVRTFVKSEDIFAKQAHKLWVNFVAVCPRRLINESLINKFYEKTPHTQFITAVCVCVPHLGEWLHLYLAFLFISLPSWLSSSPLLSLTFLPPSLSLSLPCYWLCFRAKSIKFVPKGTF